MLKKSLAHPMLRGLVIDDPRTMLLRKEIIRQKPFLRKIYEDWYAAIFSAVPDGEGKVLELGSGGGFMSEYIDGIITSDVMPCPGVQMVVDACTIPFENGSLRAIVMTDVLHHLPDVRRFFDEATRCVRKGGAIVMIEPWVSKWSSFVFKRFHTEPFESERPSWEFPESGPLSGANQALPWIIFKRDRRVFESEYPCWKIKSIKPCMPFRYLVSGGVSMRSLMPSWSYRFWHGIERVAGPLIEHLAMFAQIELLKISPGENIKDAECSGTKFHGLL